MKPQLYANHKCCLNWHRVDDYLAGRNIFPRTVELDLTNRCSRACPMCPTPRSGAPLRELSVEFVDRFLGILEGETRGIILSGGEPTMSVHFAEILRTARRRGFEQIAVITNGSELGRPEIQDALMENATSIRVSLYDWYDSDTPSPSFFGQLARVTALRKRVDRCGSKLELGVAMLTSRNRLPRILNAIPHVEGSGAHWLYFHPLCEEWKGGHPVQSDQTGVLDALQDVQRQAPTGMDVYVAEQRYSRYPLAFRKFHAAHFLLQVSSDGINYASPESKLHPTCAIADLNEYMEDDFLWRPERLAKIAALDSETYGFAGTRHRGAMFSDFLERYLRGDERELAIAHTASESDFHHPNLC